MKLSEMRELLAARGIQLTKSLGQNFLHDANQLRRIVEAAELSKTDKVLEIGPGLGPLTELLLENAGEVLAIEKDARLVEFLRERFNVAQASRLPDRKKNRAGETPALHLLHADALEFLKREPRDWSDWKLVANLPYSVASPILVELAQSAQRPRTDGRHAATRSRPAAHGQGRRRRLRHADAAGATRLRAARMVQDSGGLFFPGAGRGFGLRGFGAPRRSRFCRKTSAQLL